MINYNYKIRENKGKIIRIVTVNIVVFAGFMVVLCSWVHIMIDENTLREEWKNSNSFYETINLIIKNHYLFRLM